MKIAAFGVLASVSGIGAGGVAEDALIQYGALAILAASLAYVLGWTIPSLLRAFAAQRESFQAASEAKDKIASDVLQATRHDFRDSLAGMSRAVENIAAATSEARRSAGQ
jgi:hypothetical protein